MTQVLITPPEAPAAAPASTTTPQAPTAAPRIPPPVAEAAASNFAVERCSRAFKSAYDAEFARGRNRYDAHDAGEKALRDAMPPLTTRQNIRDFVACVAQGVLLNAIEDKQASRLLTAANIALRSLYYEASLKSEASDQAD